MEDVCKVTKRLGGRGCGHKKRNPARHEISSRWILFFFPPPPPIPGTSCFQVAMRNVRARGVEFPSRPIFLCPRSVAQDKGSTETGERGSAGLFFFAASQWGQKNGVHSPAGPARPYCKTSERRARWVDKGPHERKRTWKLLPSD